MAFTEKGLGVPVADLRRSPDVREAVSSLTRLIGVWPLNIENISRTEHHRLLAKLRQALRAERQRGIAGHWTYDLARHSELLAVYRLLVASVAGSKSSRRRQPNKTSAGQILDRSGVQKNAPH